MKTLEQLDFELEQELLNSNPVFKYVIYGGVHTFSKNTKCKLVNKGIELGYELWDCFVDGVHIFSFKNYVGFGFSSQPLYLEIDYKTRKHLEVNGIYLETYI
jgi:hypothetical protein